MKHFIFAISAFAILNERAYASSAGLSTCVSLAVKVALEAYYAQTADAPLVPEICVSSKTASASDGVDVHIRIDNKTEYDVIATPAHANGVMTRCSNATIVARARKPKS